MLQEVWSKVSCVHDLDGAHLIVPAKGAPCRDSCCHLCRFILREDIGIDKERTHAGGEGCTEVLLFQQRNEKLLFFIERLVRT